MVPAAAPIAPAERIHAMDVIRGFALLGILLMNIEAMVGPLNGALTGLDPALAGADRLADALVYIFVQGKFYTLFSLLFGMGFAVMMSRAQVAGRPFARLYLRRSLALLGIGLAHMLLVWSGDILTSYALIALVLLALFANVQTRWLPWLAVALYLVPSVFNLGLGAIGSLAQLDAGAAGEFNKAMARNAGEWAADIEAQRLAYGAGSYLAASLQRLRDAGSMMTFLLFFGWQVLGMFVLGMWFVRSGAIADPRNHTGLYRGLRWLALPAGLVLMLWSFSLVPTQDMGRLDIVTGFAATLGAVAALLMSLGYLAWVVRGLQSPTFARPLALLAPAGRMALTNYLLQSLVCTLLFYGYGLGLFEQLPRAWQVPFALVLFALQVALSHAWLARFRFGPMEWLWRTLTYGARQPMRQPAR
ncbi:DUF418 domain-containing protein [Agrilutibacter solisilvae]|uniref:DUF418 domain-containing protein n=1 Tax=Agrilutibacter solisilvae TaxID=2763317 RepID=A0A975AU27_9GAMM|nr:DUF418 domain-containing protein [Lysobacter solisilvae]QSX80018.1 DUF418 domain-containing protein [Lysobacter solisilvae]